MHATSQRARRLATINHSTKDQRIALRLLPVELDDSDCYGCINGCDESPRYAWFCDQEEENDEGSAQGCTIAHAIEHARRAWSFEGWDLQFGR